MKFKELFDKEFLYESSKADEKKGSKIFYKFDINIKKKEEAVNDNTAAIDNTAQTQNDVSQPAPVDNGVNAAPATTPTPIDNGVNPAPAPVDNMAAPAPEINLPLPSVVTEDGDDNGNNENNVSINDDNNIVRKLEGELFLTKEDIDSIQTIEDIITKLTEEKVDGANVLDEFTADILQVIVNPATQMQLKDKIDKESTIFAEILYGKKRENSVGMRVIKRKNSDLLTTSMMIDNKIINAQYKKDTLDKRITDYRNDEYEED